MEQALISGDWSGSNIGMAKIQTSWLGTNSRSSTTLTIQGSRDRISYILTLGACWHAPLPVQYIPALESVLGRKGK
jgi:hypothetical protein